MKQKLTGTLGLIMLVMMVIRAGAAQGQSTSPGPYYATPSWDQKLAASKRFIVLSNWGGAAVLDKETGLVWERSPSTVELTWFAALDQCDNLTLGNRMGWRLPRVQELTSLIDPSITDYPTIRLPAGHPFQNIQQVYWSATSRTASPADAVLAVMFVNAGYVTTGGLKVGNGWAWCVRGGSGLEAE